MEIISGRCLIMRNFLWSAGGEGQPDPLIVVYLAHSLVLAFLFAT